MSFEASSFDDNSNQHGEYGLQPVGPEMFESIDTPKEGEISKGPMSDVMGVEPLSKEEMGAWERTLDSFDEPLFPALEELNEINRPLAAFIGDMYRTPRSEEQRRDAEQSLRQRRSDILNSLEEVLVDMQEHIGTNDQFFSYATDLIHNHTAGRAAYLNEEIGSGSTGYFKPAKYKKVMRWISSVLEYVDDESEIPQEMINIYAGMLDEHLDCVGAILKEVYRDHDRQELLHKMGEVVGLLQQIADTIGPAITHDTGEQDN